MRIAFALSIISSHLCFSQSVSLGPNLRIKTGNLRITSEGTLAAHPTNEDHLVACYLSANVDHEGYDYRTEIVISIDGGKNWELLSLDSPEEAADPWCLINEDGSLVVTDISSGRDYHLTTRYIKDSIITSSQGYGHDHSILLPGKEGQLLLLSTQKNQLVVHQSSDQGKTFELIQRTLPYPNLSINGKNPVALSTSYWIIPFTTRFRSDPEGNEVPLDRALSWMVKWNKKSGPSKPYLITDRSGNRHHILAVNREEKFKDQLYYFYSGAEDQGVFLTVSQDHGASWKDSIQLDKNSSSRTIPGAMTIHPKGYAGFIWTEQTPAGCWRKYFTVSFDGGLSFKKPVDLQHGTLSCPDQTNGWVGKAWPQGGDYCGLVSFDNGFRAVWSDARTGKFQLYFTEITIQ